MLTSDRFARLWGAWDARVRAGEPAAGLLASVDDEDLIELLAGESSQSRADQRRSIAAELLERLRARSAHATEGADEALRTARRAQAAAQRGQEAIHRSESLLHESGDHELGREVSASAYESLDRSNAAVDAAQEHVANVRGALERGGPAAAQRAAPADTRAKATARATARAAQRGEDVTRDLEREMTSEGHAVEGRAAAKAGADISKAADAAVDSSAAAEERSS